MKIKKIIDKTVEIGVIASLTGMILSVVIQVFTRFFMESAPSWTEEVARIFFIYAVVFGGGLAIRDHAYVHLDFFIEKFSLNIKRRIHLVSQIIILLFGLLLFYYSIQFIQIGFSETSPSLGLKMAYVFGSMVLLPIFIIYYATNDLIDKLTQNKS